MKRVNFNIKDRKVLTVGLCLVLVCVFSLTIAYAALSAVLTISGNAEVASSTWNVYLANPEVKSGSVNSNLPTISGNTLTFSATLSMPGDYYEFTVDVVNGGTIDAMIESFVKTPDLTATQAKYLKYEVSYENGESINTKQILSKGSSMPIKVKLEYRRDLVASDLPTSATTLTLKLSLVYSQSDGSGSNVSNNGKLISANGNVTGIGTIVTIGSEKFYTIGTDGNNIKLLSMYNLYVGNSIDENNKTTALASPTGKQSELARGYVNGVYPHVGITAFSSTSQYGVYYSDYVGSVVEKYVNNYKNIMETDYGIEIAEARLITYEELVSGEIGCSEANNTCSGAPSFITSTSYWTGSNVETGDVWSAYWIWHVLSSGAFDSYDYFESVHCGVRPVIVISKDYFN